MDFNDQFDRFERQETRRRKHWALFRTKSLTSLEKFLKEEGETLDPSMKASLAEFIRRRRRSIKVRLEEQEKSGEYLEKMALPVAAAIGFVGSICAVTLEFPQFTPQWKTATTFAFNVVGAITWYLIRLQGIRQVKAARKRLTLLGMVE